MATLKTPLSELLVEGADGIKWAREEVDPHIPDILAAIDGLTDGKLGIILAAIKDSKPDSTLTIEKLKAIVVKVRAYAVREHEWMASGDDDKIEAAARKWSKWKWLLGILDGSMDLSEDQLKKLEKS